MQKYYILITFILAIIAPCTCTFGQLYNFTNYNMEQGLPQSTVFCINEDARGYLWVGTESGAARFDGTNFSIIDRSNGLPGNIVRSIVEDSQGNIWFGTDKGIGIFNGTNWKTITTENGLLGSVITKLLPDNKGRMWAATNDAGVNIISTFNDSIQIQNISSQQGLAGDFVLDLMHDSNGKTWIAMFGGLSTVTLSQNKPQIKNINDSIRLPSKYITSIAEDKKGNIWFGTLDTGAYKWKKNSTEFTPCSLLSADANLRIWDIHCDTDGSVWFASEKNGVFRSNNNTIQNISTSNGLLGSQIFCIYRDNNKNLWLGSIGQGLSKFQGFQLVHYSVAEGLPGSSVMAIKPDDKGQLWLGTNQQGLGLASIKNDQIKVHTFTATNAYRTSEITTIDIDNQGRILAGTRGQGLLIINDQFNYLTTAKGLLDNNINCVYNAPNGSIYVGSDLGFNEIAGQQIHTISEEQGLINPEVQTVISDKANNIWMGTLGGLARFRAKTSEYRDFDEQEGLFDLSIHTLAADKNNVIWIGTNNGIYNYNPTTDTITPFTQAILNSKAINSLLFYNDSTLMVGTNHGFNKLTFDTDVKKVKNVRQYDKSNGFIWSETNYNAICSDEQKHIWFGTVNGLTSYRPEMEDTLTKTPTVHLTGIRLSFENVNWEAQGFHTDAWNAYPNKLSLPHHQNHVTFDYVGIHFKNPEKVIFKYKLAPHEKEWSPATANTSVTYPGLTNSKYSFSVIASADGINWSQPVVYNFVIQAPFWKTLWFLTIIILFLIVALYLFIRWREKKLLKEKAHLEKVVKERTAEVVAQKDEIQSQKEEITGSINYAERIQRAILPGIENLQQNTDDAFILFKPCHIVSGDYYWIERLDRQLIVTAADCTGHGVPGAFMSMLGVSFLNKIVKEQKIDAPDIILGQMRQNVISSLKQGDYAGSSKDGMDMAICVINIDTLEMNFAGAYNSAIIIRNSEASELKADRMPVGYHIKMSDFTATKIQLLKDDCIYMYSDGFQDQIGGPRERKFMRKNMRELLVDIHTKTFAEQHRILNTTIKDWMNHPDGKTHQMDDILIIGFKV
ncbi:MAG: SpoIIE family protein phosphatase [Salinivirgaceae bacterium]|nr:SpoIIE family protein phosphatase [Salinivirgaceae bacterium]